MQQLHSRHQRDTISNGVAHPKDNLGCRRNSDGSANVVSNRRARWAECIAEHQLTHLSTEGKEPALHAALHGAVGLGAPGLGTNIRCPNQVSQTLAMRNVHIATRDATFVRRNAFAPSQVTTLPLFGNEFLGQTGYAGRWDAEARMTHERIARKERHRMHPLWTGRYWYKKADHERHERKPRRSGRDRDVSAAGNILRIGQDAHAGGAHV